MVSYYSNYIRFTIAVALFFLLTLLLQVMTVQAEEINDAEFNFVAAGDWGCGDKALKTLSMMKSMKPELYLGLGDYSYELSADCWLNLVKPVDKSFKISIGNHDTLKQKLQAYMDEFKLDKQYYSFDYHNAHFIALSTELNKQETVDQLQFVRNDLIRTKGNQNIDWTIVFFHKPFYSGSNTDYTNMRRTYHPLFEEFGVDLVVQGHSHNYQRSYPLLFNEVTPSEPIVSDKERSDYNYPKGTIFVIAGTGGESVQQINKKPFLASSYEGYGCINVEIKGKSLRVEYYSDSNDTIDKFVITKSAQNSKNEHESDELQRIEYDDLIR